MNKHFQYFKHLALHKFYVAKECFKRGLYWQGIIHDWTKFLPLEWFTYAQRFYGDKTTPKDSEQFRYAWLNHQKINKHHWQAWVLIGDDGKIKPLKMPEKYIIEMWCDWIGTSMAIDGKNDAEEWYNRNKENMILHPETRKFLENLIKSEKHFETR